MPTITAHQSRYSGKLYLKESDCLHDEFYACREKARVQLAAFFVHRHASRRNDDNYADLWETLKTLRTLETAFYEALGREHVAEADRRVVLLFDSTASPTSELTEPDREGVSNA